MYVPNVSWPGLCARTGEGRVGQFQRRLNFGIWDLIRSSQTPDPSFHPSLTARARRRARVWALVEEASGSARLVKSPTGPPTVPSSTCCTSTYSQSFESPERRPPETTRNQDGNSHHDLLQAGEARPRPVPRQADIPASAEHSASRSPPMSPATRTRAPQSSPQGHPSLEEALSRAAQQGAPFVILDGILNSSDRYSTRRRARKALRKDPRARRASSRPYRPPTPPAVDLRRHSRQHPRHHRRSRTRP